MDGKRRVSTNMVLVVIVITLIGLWMKSRSYLHVDSTKAQAVVYKRRETIHELSEVRDFHLEETDITIVTAYFDIGTFRKGGGNLRHRDEYLKWASIFKYIQNNLVVFTDSVVFIDKMLDLRKDTMTKTKIMSVKKEEAWPFQNLEKITKIFNSSYPKFIPNTVHPLYSCVTHAKFYLLEIAAEQNYFGTKYIMWLDVGYFRRRKSMALFYMGRPKGFDDSRIAMNKVFKKAHFHHSPETIIKRKKVAIGGGLVFGERLHMLKFAKQFEGAVNYFLNQNLTNTEEQIIYALFSDKGRQLLKPEVQLQLYNSSKPMDWFYLGNYMIKEI